MIVDSDGQYQRALDRITELKDAKEGTNTYNELQDLITEVKIYEHKHYPEGKPEEKSFEFWSLKEGRSPSSTDDDDFNIVKLKESELSDSQIGLLVKEFMIAFEKLPAKGKRLVRKKLQY